MMSRAAEELTFGVPVNKDGVNTDGGGAAHHGT